MAKRESKDKRSNEDKIELSFLDKEKCKISESLEQGNMVAVLSGMEIMYVVILNGMYRCIIHKFDAEEGRHKSFEINDRNRAMLNNLNSAADQIFQVRFDKKLELMGVMVAAERGIISYLDMTGQLPAEDVDFMDWQEGENQKEEKQ
jgi:hypothetical protein